MRLSSRFGAHSSALRSNDPLTEAQMRGVAPSIFATAAHTSRSPKYSYIPTSTVLASLRKEGFQPFMVAQTRVREASRHAFTKHMIRLRHANQINDTEAHEIVLLNSHDGTSSYQMISGMLRFVCCNGIVCGDSVNDVRVPHKGQIVDRVIEGAYEVLLGFGLVREKRDGMRAVTLDAEEATLFARSALALKYEDADKAPPVTEAQVLAPRRHEDDRPDLWSTFNRVQESLTQGGLPSRCTNGRRQRTRPVEGIDQNVKLNRALWMLAEGMRRLKQG